MDDWDLSVSETGKDRSDKHGVKIGCGIEIRERDTHTQGKEKERGGRDTGTEGERGGGGERHRDRQTDRQRNLVIKIPVHSVSAVGTRSETIDISK